MNLNDAYIYSLYFLVAFITFLILYYRERLEAFLRKYKLTNKMILLLSLIFSLYFWGPNLKADWGMTDDHMIMHYFIDNPKVSLLEVPELIMEKTEVGKFGNTTINRPFYYSGRVIESALWQKNVSLWYLARIIMFFVSLALLWVLIEKWIGFFYGGIFIFYVLTFSYWPWIWGYIGPAENYAMFGCALYLHGFLNLVPRIKSEETDKKGILAYSLVLLLGSLIAIGSKENFLILTIPLIYLIFLLFRKKVRSLPLTISLVAIFIYSTLIATGVYLGLTRAGGDVYGRSIGILERLRLTYESIVITSREIDVIWILLAILLALTTLMFAAGSKTRLEKYKAAIKNFFFVSFGLFALYASQVFFYNGVFPPTSLRYSFPGMLAIPLFGILTLITFFSILEIIGLSKFIVNQAKNAVFVTLLIVILANGYQEARAFVKNNVIATNSFSAKMASYYKHLENNPEEPVVFDSYSVWNVEPIASVRAYLLANNVKNPMFLRLNFAPVPEPSNSNDKVAYRIYGFLDHISNNGGCGFTGAEYTFLSGGDCDQWGFQPITQLNGDYFTIKIDEQNEIYGSANSN